VRIEENHRFIINDTWTAGDEAVDVAWQWLTRAKAVVTADGAVLTEGGETLFLRVLAPMKDWSFTVEETDGMLELHDEPNPGLRRLVLHTRTAAQETGRIVIAAEPAASADH
jgi:hypothetical protein